MILQEATAVIAFFRGLNQEDERVVKEVESLKNQDLHFKSLPNVNFINIRTYNAFKYKTHTKSVLEPLVEENTRNTQNTKYG